MDLRNRVRVHVCMRVQACVRACAHHAWTGWGGKVGSLWPLQISLFVGLKTKLWVRRLQGSSPPPPTLQDFPGSLESGAWLRRGLKHALPPGGTGAVWGGGGEGEAVMAGRKAKMVLASLSPPSPRPLSSLISSHRYLLSTYPVPDLGLQQRAGGLSLHPAASRAALRPRRRLPPPAWGWGGGGSRGETAPPGPAYRLMETTWRGSGAPPPDPTRHHSHDHLLLMRAPSPCIPAPRAY